MARPNPFQLGAAAVCDAFARLGSGADRVARDLVYLRSPAAPTGPELPGDVDTAPDEIRVRGFSDDFTYFERNNQGVEIRDALIIIPTLKLRAAAKKDLGLPDFRPSDEDQVRDVALDRTFNIRRVDTDVPRAAWYLTVQA